MTVALMTSVYASTACCLLVLASMTINHFLTMLLVKKIGFNISVLCLNQYNIAVTLHVFLLQVPIVLNVHGPHSNGLSGLSYYLSI